MDGRDDTMSYDAIVVGGRCAGAPLAMLLARAGYRVLVADKADFPSEVVVSTHYVHNLGLARLQSWGLLEQLEATGCPRIPTLRFDFGSIVLTGAPPAVDGLRHGTAPRRIVLDKLLLDAALEAGAELREAFAVDSLIWEDGRVVGIKGRHRRGPTVEERARVVIGADGVHSAIARLVETPMTDERPAFTIMYYSYWSGLDVSSVEIYVREGRCLVTFPTHEHLAVILVVWSASVAASVRGDVEGAYMRAVADFPHLAARVREARREERFLGASGLKNFLRRSHGPGWALAGDAGYHRDPVTGQGISDAFCDADILAAAIDAGLRSGDSAVMDAALREREALRDRRARPRLDLTCERARLEPLSPELLRLLAGIAGSQDDIDQFIGLDAGTTSIDEFFAEPNRQRLLAASSEA